MACIIDTLRKLRKHNPGLKTNLFQLLLHYFVLSIYFAVAVVTCLIEISKVSLSNKQKFILNLILLGSETMC